MGERSGRRVGNGAECPAQVRVERGEGCGLTGLARPGTWRVGSGRSGTPFEPPIPRVVESFAIGPAAELVGQRPHSSLRNGAQVWLMRLPFRARSRQRAGSGRPALGDGLWATGIGPAQRPTSVSTSSGVRRYCTGARTAAPGSARWSPIATNATLFSWRIGRYVPSQRR